MHVGFPVGRDEKITGKGSNWETKTLWPLKITGVKKEMEILRPMLCVYVCVLSSKFNERKTSGWEVV
jgi:hypothetical protein